MVTNYNLDLAEEKLINWGLESFSQSKLMIYMG